MSLIEKKQLWLKFGMKLTAHSFLRSDTSCFNNFNISSESTVNTGTQLFVLFVLKFLIFCFSENITKMASEI